MTDLMKVQNLLNEISDSLDTFKLSKEPLEKLSYIIIEWYRTFESMGTLNKEINMSNGIVSTATQFDVIGYLKSEVERLQNLLTAERLHNQRIMCANSELKEAVGLGLSLVHVAKNYKGGLPEECFDNNIDRIQACVENADKLALPFSKNTEEVEVG